MLNVSNDWKIAMGNYNNSARPRFTPKAKVKLNYNIVNSEASTTSTFTANEAEFSDVDEINDINYEGSRTNFATLELNNFILDGELTIWDTTEQSDYELAWANNTPCNASGLWQTNPTLTITFDDELEDSLPGLTINWSNTLGLYATSYLVQAFDEEDVALKEVLNQLNTNVETWVPLEQTGVKKVIITILSWNIPNRLARVEHIIFGTILSLSNSELFSYEHDMEADLNTLKLPKNQIKFEIDNTNNDFNPDNSNGLYGMLAEQQKVDVYYSVYIDDEYEDIHAGTFYTTKWETPLNGLTVSFTASSLPDLMTDIFTWPAAGTYTYKQLAELAFSQSNLPTNDDLTVKYSVDADYANESYVVTGNEKELKCLAIILLIANAHSGVIKIDENGSVILTTLDITQPIETDYIIDSFTSYTQPEYELSKVLKDIKYNNAYTISIGSTGVNQSITNMFITSLNKAITNATWLYSVLGKRKSLSCDYRSDPRLLLYDYVVTDNKYAQNEVYITSIKYSFSGSFKGNYTGKVMKSRSREELYGDVYANEIKANEVR